MATDEAAPVLWLGPSRFPCPNRRLDRMLMGWLPSWPVELCALASEYVGCHQISAESSTMAGGGLEDAHLSNSWASVCFSYLFVVRQPGHVYCANVCGRNVYVHDAKCQKLIAPGVMPLIAANNTGTLVQLAYIEHRRIIKGWVCGAFGEHKFAFAVSSSLARFKKPVLVACDPLCHSTCDCYSVFMPPFTYCPSLEFSFLFGWVDAKCVYKLSGTAAGRVTVARLAAGTVKRATPLLTNPFGVAQDCCSTCPEPSRLIRVCHGWLGLYRKGKGEPIQICKWKDANAQTFRS